MQAVKGPSGDRYMIACKLATLIFYNVKVGRARGCNTTQCLCGTDEEGPFVPLTHDEAEEFWADMRLLADQRLAEYQRDK